MNKDELDFIRLAFIGVFSICLCASTSLMYENIYAGLAVMLISIIAIGVCALGLRENDH